MAGCFEPTAVASSAVAGRSSRVAPPENDPWITREDPTGRFWTTGLIGGMIV
jgi:hypothetical protein